MTTAEVMHDDAPPAGEQGKPTRSQVPPSSAPMSASWLLRMVGRSTVTVCAGAMGVIVAPGVRGNTSEQVVEWIEGTSAALAYFLVAVLVALALWGALEVLRANGVGLVARIALVGPGAIVVVLSSLVVAFPLLFGMRERLEPRLAVSVSAAAAVASIAAAYKSARAPHTRAVAGVLFAFACASIARIAAWELATAAGDRASMQLFGYARALATAGVLFEAMGQLVAVTWLGTRSRLAGQLGASAALVMAFALTWGVARGMHSGAAPWQSILHTALADAPGVPAPYGFDAVATFLVPASLLLALVAASQPKQVGCHFGHGRTRTRFARFVRRASSRSLRARRRLVGHAFKRR